MAFGDEGGHERGGYRFGARPQVPWITDLNRLRLVGGTAAQGVVVAVLAVLDAERGDGRELGLFAQAIECLFERFGMGAERDEGRGE